MLLPEILEAKVKIRYNVNEKLIEELNGIYSGTQLFGESQSMLGIFDEKKKVLVLIPFERIIAMECKNICIPDDEEDDVSVS